MENRNLKMDCGSFEIRTWTLNHFAVILQSEHYPMTGEQSKGFAARPVVLLRIASIIALFTLPFALAEAGNAPGRIPLLCLTAGIPHLIAAFAPASRSGASIGIALGSSLLLFSGLTFNTLLSVVLLFPVAGSSWPWLFAAVAHGLMFAAGVVATRSQRAPIADIPIYGCVGFAYSILSVVLIQKLAKLSF
jgi:hypothetical protein